VVIQILNARLRIVRFGRVFDGIAKQVGEPLQRVLVHGVDDSQVHDGEEQDLSAEGNWPEAFARVVNLLLSDGGVGLADVDVIGSHFRLVQHVDEGVIFEDLLDLRVLGQVVQDLFLDFSEGLGGLSVLNNDLVLFLLKVRHLHHDELVEHLFFEAVRGDGEVKNVDLHLGLRRVTGVRQVGHHEELEVIVVGNGLISNPERTGFVNQLRENGLPCWIELFTNILDEGPLAELNADFEVPHEGCVFGFKAVEAVRSLFGVPGQTLDEFGRLGLGINHKGPSHRLEDDDSILNGQLVAGKVVGSPGLG